MKYYTLRMEDPLPAFLCTPILGDVLLMQQVLLEHLFLLAVYYNRQ